MECRSDSKMKSTYLEKLIPGMIYALFKGVQSYKGDKIMELTSYKEETLHPRHSLDLPIDLWQTQDVLRAAVITDMSGAGLGIRSIYQFQISAELGIRIYLSREEFSFDSIEGTCRVIWRAADHEQDWTGYRYGMYIKKMAPYSRDRLMKYIQMLEQEESFSH